MRNLKQFIKTTIREFLNERKLDDYSLSIKKIEDDYFVLAKKGNIEVGKLSFIISKFKPKLIGTSVVVNPNYRRLGIATDMYNFAENKLNMKFIPNENVLTPDGKKFWDSRNK
jgi:GNAT superfamily N-acetyltransferase